MFFKKCPLSTSDHFDGKCYHNQEPGEFSLKDIIPWILTTQIERWPKWIDNEKFPPPPRRVELGEIRVTFIQHATFLVQVDGLNILIDPIWSRRCGPFSLFGPARVRLPGVAWEDLPPIDIVLISHNHYDHLDLPTLRGLSGKHMPICITAKGNAKLIKKTGIQSVVELDWWDEHEPIADLKVMMVPARHTSGRSSWDRNKTLWGGFFIRSKWGAIYFSGDTAYGKHFRQIRARCGIPNLALLPIGSYMPRHLMRVVHMNPFESVQAHIELGFPPSIGMHFGTFRLSDEGFNEPVLRLDEARQLYGIPPSKFIVPKEGKSWP